jgi:hypothetical protein
MGDGLAEREHDDDRLGIPAPRGKDHSSMADSVSVTTGVRELIL